jgi:PAS domain S-box-containing protein
MKLRLRSVFARKSPSHWDRYVVAVISTLVALALSIWLEDFLTQTVATFFYLAVVLSTWYGGRRPGLLSMALSAVLLEQFLIYNHQYWWWQDPETVGRLLTFVVTALVMLLLTDNLRRSRDQLRVSRSQLALQSQQAIRQANDDLATLQLAELRWHTLFDNVQMIVVGLGLLGQIEYVNPHFLQVTGYDPQAIIGKSSLDLLRPQDIPQIRHDFREFVAQGDSYTCEYTLVTSTGAELLIVWYCTFMRNAAGHITGVMSIGEDVTQRQALEKTKNEFISVVSHELRTPLTGIRGSLGLLASGIYDQNPEKSRRMLEVACEQSDRLIRLVNDILDLERLESGQPDLPRSACAVSDLIQKSVETLRCPADQAQVTITISSNHFTGLMVWANPDAIIQTLTNLLSNAIKFSAPHNCVQVNAQINTRKDAKNIIFSVQDWGRGIPADKLEAIFDRFQQVDSSDARQKGGTGLGLAICRQIIQQHGGQIWVESVIDRGSTFYFTLPPVVPTAHGVQASFSN